MGRSRDIEGAQGRSQRGLWSAAALEGGASTSPHASTPSRRDLAAASKRTARKKRKKETKQVESSFGEFLANAHRTSARAVSKADTAGAADTSSVITGMVSARAQEQELEAADIELACTRDRARRRKAVGWLRVALFATVVTAVCAVVLAAALVLLMSLVVGRPLDPWMWRYAGVAKDLIVTPVRGLLAFRGLSF